jgi:hypothetical protein
MPARRAEAPQSQNRNQSLKYCPAAAQIRVTQDFL